MIVKRKGKFVLLDADGKKVLGTHDTFQQAVKQEYAIGKSMGKSKEEIQKLIKTEVARNYKKAYVSNGYVALKVAKPDANKLSLIFNNLGLTGLIKPDKMHMTLMYDKKEGPNNYTANNKSYKAKVIGIDRLGKKGSQWEAIVLKVHSPEIANRHKELKDQGFKHSYGNLLQHISIKYKPSSMDTVIAKKALNVIKNKLPEITLGNEFTEPLNEKPTKKAFLMNGIAQKVLQRANEKTAAIKLRPFKELKSIKLPWYKRLLAKKIAPNNPDIQQALRQAMPGASGRLSRILQKMTDVKNIS